MTDMRKGFVVYIRVSTEEQARHGFSIEAQKKVLTDCAEARGLKIVRFFVESESAFKAKSRPIFQEMIRYIRRHKRDIRGVLVYKIDRPARNLTDFAEISEMEGIELVSATEPLPEGATGQMIAGVQAVFARHASQVTSERVSLGMRTKAEKGLWPSTAPIGYLNDPATKTIVPDPVSSHKILELFQAYASGRYSESELAELACGMGLRGRRGGKLSRSQVHWILTNPIYYGDFYWKDKLYRGTHTPLISKQLFDKVQQRLHCRGKQREERDFPYRGILTCGYCGCKITAERHVKKDTEYVHYHCTNGRGKCVQPWVNEETLGDKLAEVVDRVHLTEEQVAFLVRLLEGDADERIEVRKQRIKKLKRDRAQIESRRDSAYQDKLDGKIDEERWLRLDDEWEQQAGRLDDQIALLRATTEPRHDKAVEAFELLKRAPELYLQQNAQQRAELLHELVSNCEIKGDKLDPVYRKPFDAVAEGLRTGDWYARQDSNL